MDIKLIAFDLDGTFLDKAKCIPPANLAAVEKAAKMGIHIVPATGRIYTGIPEPVRSLPFIRYFITCNGAQIYDLQEQRVLARAELPVEDALPLLHYEDSLNAPYDCYIDNWGYMNEDMMNRAEEYVTDPGILWNVKNLRSPVPELKSFLEQRGGMVQKLQIYFYDMQERQRQLEVLPAMFTRLNISSSLPFNIEVNSINASKGRALEALCGILGLEREQTMAFGDGTNDLDMLRYAGIGVAMENAEESTKLEADYTTLSNEQAGVAYTINNFLGI